MFLKNYLKTLFYIPFTTKAYTFAEIYFRLAAKLYTLKIFNPIYYTVCELWKR